MKGIVLLNHTPEEWADKMHARLLAIGVKKYYANRVANNIRAHTQLVASALGQRWEKEGE